jgi:hypothetical protein
MMAFTLRPESRADGRPTLPNLFEPNTSREMNAYLAIASRQFSERIALLELVDGDWSTGVAPVEPERLISRNAIE